MATSPDGNSQLSLSDLEEEIGSGGSIADEPACCSCHTVNCNITVTNTAVCIFINPVFPKGHPSGRVNWMAICFLLLWVLGILLAAFGVTCLLSPHTLGGEPVCGHSDGLLPIVLTCIGGVFALGTVPLVCCAAVFTDEDH